MLTSRSKILKFGRGKHRSPIWS